MSIAGYVSDSPQGPSSLICLAEAIRAKEDTVPDWFTKGERGDEGGRSLQEIQVHLEYFWYGNLRFFVQTSKYYSNISA